MRVSIEMKFVPAFDPKLTCSRSSQKWAAALDSVGCVTRRLNTIAPFASAPCA